MLLIYLALVDDLSDKDKIEKIYTKYYGLMIYITDEFVHDPHDKEDIVHNSMLKIIKNIEKIDISDEIKTKSFCKTIVKNTAIDFLRKKENQNISYDDAIETECVTNNLLDVVISNETFEHILKAIDSLSDKYKTVCILKYVSGLKEREIAEILDLSPKTVSLRIFRGKQILREAIRKENIYDK